MLRRGVGRGPGPRPSIRSSECTDRSRRSRPPSLTVMSVPQRWKGPLFPSAERSALAAPGEAAADGEAGREMADMRVGPVPAAARTRHRRTGRHRHLPGRWREDAARRRLVLDFLEGDDIGIQGGDLARDGVVVGLGAAHATFPVGVVEVLQVPGGDAQLAGMSGWCRQAQRQERKHNQECRQGQGSAPQVWLAARGADGGKDGRLVGLAAKS